MSIKILLRLLLSASILYSCTGQKNKDETCVKKFKKAKDLAYGNPDRPSALDSALSMTNDILGCDSLKRILVDFKIMLLESLQRYPQALSFVDSSNVTDFNFAYGKKVAYRGIQILAYSAKNDEIHVDSVRKLLAAELETYIKKQKPIGREFKQIYTVLLGIKELYLSVDQLNIEVDSLKNKYPDDDHFFNFFKRDSTYHQ